MEAVGLVVGIVGIVPVCLDLLERFNSIKSFATLSQHLRTQFDANKLKLERWAHTVGIIDGSLTDEHHHALDDPEVSEIVFEILKNLVEVIRDLQQVPKRSHFSSRQIETQTREAPFGDYGRTKTEKLALPGGTIWQSLRWASGGKLHYSEGLDLMNKFVQLLYDLVPPAQQPHSETTTNPSTVVSLAALGETQKVTPTESSTLSIDFQASLQELIGDMRRSHEERAHKLVEEWLDAPKIDQQLDRFISERLQGTCDWILDSDVFHQWVDDKFDGRVSKILWIHGPAGHGKTIMCARVIQHLSSEKTSPVVYFFSSSYVQSGGSLIGVVRAWLHQLARISESIFELVYDGIQLDPKSLVASDTQIWALFASAVAASDGGIFVVDGLDEFPSKEDGRILFLRKFKKALAGTRARSLFTSRPEPDIAMEFSDDHCKDMDLLLFECRLVEDNLRSDLAKFCDHIVTQQLPSSDRQFGMELAATMTERCKGMFLLAKLQQGELREGKSRKMLRKIVEAIPDGLEQSYERNWLQIQNLGNFDRQRAINILRWATFGYRPLTIAELSEALIVDHTLDTVEYPSDELCDEINEIYIENEIKRLCGSLIEVRTGSYDPSMEQQTVHIVHVTVSEFLVKVLPSPLTDDLVYDRVDLVQKSQHAFLLKICLRYLGYNEVWDQEVSQSLGVKSSFLKYAQYYWSRHAEASLNYSDSTNDVLNKFFQPNSQAFISWLSYIDPGSDSTKNYLEPWPSLFYAAQYGLVPTLDHLLSFSDIDINQVMGHLGTALQAACISGNSTVYRHLRERQADVNVQGGDRGSALHVAVLWGYTKIVKDLLACGANSSCTDKHGRTPLHFAATNGHVELVEVLLAHASLTDHADDRGWTPLHIAAEKNHVHVVKKLLAHGASSSVAGVEGWTPLHFAVDSGFIEVVKELLSYGASVSDATTNQWNSLHIAARNGSIEVAKELLSHGASLSDLTSDQWTSLHIAADNGHIEVVKELLSHGASVSDVTSRQETPLHVAAGKGCTEVVKELLSHGASASVITSEQWTPLQLAAEGGHIELVRELMAHGARALSVTNDGWTPLHLAAQGGHIELVRELMAHGASVSSATNNGWTPLHYAIEGGHTELVRELMAHGASVSSATNDGWTSLHLAAQGSHIELVRELLAHGASVSSATNNGWTPLHHAIKGGHPELIEELIAHGASTSRPTGDGSTPLHLAARGGHVEIIKILLEHESHREAMPSAYQPSTETISLQGLLQTPGKLCNPGWTNIQTFGGQTPLHVAIIRNSESCVEALLSYGADVSIKDLWGRNCLSWAAELGLRFPILEKACLDWQGSLEASELERQRLSSSKIRAAVDDILLGRQPFSLFYDPLGRCLLSLNLFEEASLMLQQDMTITAPGIIPSFDVSCDGCSCSPIIGPRYVCRTCPDIDVCEECIEVARRDGFNPTCKNHEYFRILDPTRDVVEFFGDVNLGVSEPCRQWLEHHLLPKLVELEAKLQSALTATTELPIHSISQ